MRPGIAGVDTESEYRKVNTYLRNSTIGRGSHLHQGAK
ncbi:hypothetical protein [Stenotrophomonas phage CM2]